VGAGKIPVPAQDGCVHARGVPYVAAVAKRKGGGWKRRSGVSWVREGAQGLGGGTGEIDGAKLKRLYTHWMETHP